MELENARQDYGINIRENLASTNVRIRKEGKKRSMIERITG